jgi:hypothetical protein
LKTSSLETQPRVREVRVNDTHLSTRKLRIVESNLAHDLCMFKGKVPRGKSTARKVELITGKFRPTERDLRPRERYVCEVRMLTEKARVVESHDPAGERGTSESGIPIEAGAREVDDSTGYLNSDEVGMF